MTYCLSEVNNVAELENFTALMVDKSGIVWSMQFDQITNEQLLELKKEDELFINFLIKNRRELDMVTNQKIGYLRQYFLEDGFFNETQQKIQNVLSQIKKEISKIPDEKKRIELDELKKHLDALLIDMKNVHKETKNLRELHAVALGVLGSSEKEKYVRNAMIAQKEFKKRGIKVYPKVPGRVQKQWNKK